MKSEPLDNSHLSDKDVAKRANMHRAPRPFIASTLVLTIGDPKNPRVLMGQRSSRHDFMPSVYVFPGGRVDRADSFAPYAGDLSPRTERILETAVNPRRARAIALASVRETYEETGLMLGQKTQQTRNLNHPTYDAFRGKGMTPDLSGLEVFGRAITPPYRPKRFDAWFFHRHLGDVAPPPVSDSRELQNVDWFPLDEIDALELQRATVMMVGVFRDWMRTPKREPHIFFSRAMHGKFRHERFPALD